MHFLEYCPKALLDPDCEACIELAPNDKRFSSGAWHRWPFNAISQGFLFTQQWWHHATTGLKGVSHHHEDIVSFVARQLLDVVSPANFLFTNPEVLETTFQQGGMNLVRGAMNFWEDQRRVVEGEEARRCGGISGWPRRCRHAGKDRSSQSAHRAYSICACDGHGLSRAGPDRARMDYEVLYPRPFPAELAGQIPGRQGPYGLHCLLEESDR